MARRSIPGQFKVKKKQTYYAEGYDMQYMASRVTGNMMPGHFWNPPVKCKKRVLICEKERWIDVCTCKCCIEYKFCAGQVETKVKFEDLDIPRKTTKKKKGRRRS